MKSLFPLSYTATYQIHKVTISFTYTATYLFISSLFSLHIQLLSGARYLIFGLYLYLYFQLYECIVVKKLTKLHGSTRLSKHRLLTDACNDLCRLFQTIFKAAQSVTFDLLILVLMFLFIKNTVKKQKFRYTFYQFCKS